MTTIDGPVTAEQGSQPTLGGMRIGIMEAATIGGVSKAKLLVRPESGDRTIVITAGEPIEIEGVGVLSLDEVIAEVESASKVRVTLSLTAP